MKCRRDHLFTPREKALGPSAQVKVPPDSTEVVDCRKGRLEPVLTWIKLRVFSSRGLDARNQRLEARTIDDAGMMATHKFDHALPFEPATGADHGFERQS